MIEGVLERVAEIFASLHDVDSALLKFMVLAREIAGTPNGAVYLRDEPHGLYLRWRENERTDMLHLPLAVEALFAGVRHRVVPLDHPSVAQLPALTQARSNDFRYALAFPLLHDQRMVGILALGFGYEPRLSEEALRTLETVARFPAAALAHARTAALVERRAQLADGLRRFGEQALAAGGVEALHQLILETTVQITGSDQASITRVEGERVRVVAGVGKDEWLVGTEAPMRALAEALAGDGPYLVPDVARADGDQLLVKLARKNGAGSFLVLGMRHLNDLYGHLFCGRAEAHAYRAEEIEAMRILASMAGAFLAQRKAQAAAELESQKLQEMAQAKDRFLRVAAHELRTPVTALHATLQLIDMDPSTFEGERRETMLTRLRRQCGRMVKLVQQLLDSARLEAGELPLQLKQVELGELCRDVAENAMPHNGPRTIIECPEEVWGRWDPLRIEQVLTNLLSNAAQYSPPGAEVRVRVEGDDDHARFSVIDTGIGIPEHQIEQVFTPFFRGANVAARHAGGLGLGLHIANQIVRRHGGVIHVTSRENAGTIFTVELPIRRE